MPMYITRADVLTFGVHPRLIKLFLAGVDVHPSFLMFAVDLYPDVILAVPYPPDSGANSSTEHAKAVCELSNSPFPGL